MLKLSKLAFADTEDRKNSPIIIISRRIIITQRLRNISQLAMLPADKHIPLARVIINRISNTVGISLLARSINRQTKRVSKRLDSVVWTSTLAIY